MSVFDKNGMLIRADQIELKRQENAILAGPGNDNQKAMRIDALYQARGLQPGSFYRADFDETQSGSDYDGGSDKRSTKLAVWFLLLIAIWVVFGHFFPNANEWVWLVVKSILQFIFGLIGMVIGWILKA